MQIKKKGSNIKKKKKDVSEDKSLMWFSVHNPNIIP
jgi:hypothetical protein